MHSLRLWFLLFHAGHRAVPADTDGEIHCLSTHQVPCQCDHAGLHADTPHLLPQALFLHQRHSPRCRHQSGITLFPSISQTFTSPIVSETWNFSLQSFSLSTLSSLWGFNSQLAPGWQVALRTVQMHCSDLSDSHLTLPLSHCRWTRAEGERKAVSHPPRFTASKFWTWSWGQNYSYPVSKLALVSAEEKVKATQQ